MATPEEIALQAQVAALQERIDNYEATLKEARKHIGNLERKSMLYDLLTPSEKIAVDEREASNLAKAQQDAADLELVALLKPEEKAILEARKADPAAVGEITAEKV